MIDDKKAPLETGSRHDASVSVRLGLCVSHYVPTPSLDYRWMTTGLNARALILLTMVLVFTPPQAAAQQTLDRAQLDRLMAEGMESAGTWRRGWTAFFAGSAGLSLYLGTSADTPEDRYDGRVRAVTSSLGLIDTLITTPPQIQAYEDYHALSRETPGRANAIARDTARAERRLKGWRGRIGAIIVNGGAYAAIAEGDDRPDDGLQVALIGLLVNELKLWTAPDTFSEADSINIGQTRIPLHTNLYATRHGIGLSVRF